MNLPTKKDEPGLSFLFGTLSQRYGKDTAKMRQSKGLLTANKALVLRSKLGSGESFR